MDEREKIINIIQSLGYCAAAGGCDGCKYDVEKDNYSDMSCRTLRIADALIAAGIGDVTEYKKIIRDLNTDVVAYRVLSKADIIEQIIGGQKSLIDEYKHRADVAEKALKLVSECDEISDAFCELIGEDNCDFKCHTCLYNYFLQQAEHEIEEKKKQWKKQN